MRAPTNIAVTEVMRRPALDPLPPTIRLSAPILVIVSVSTVVDRSGHRELSSGGVLDSHRNTKRYNYEKQVASQHGISQQHGESR
jgi:hypothetical protein